MRSLARLQDREGQDRVLLPGHGPAITEPAPFLAALAAHRQEREARTTARGKERDEPSSGAQ